MRICNRINTFGQKVYDDPHDSASSTPTDYPASPRGGGGGSPINTIFTSDDNHLALNVVQEESAEEEKGASKLDPGVEREHGVSSGFGGSGSDKARSSWFGAAQKLRGLSRLTPPEGGSSRTAGPARPRMSRRCHSHTHTHHLPTP